MTRKDFITALIALITAFAPKPGRAQEIKIVDYGLYTAKDVKVVQDSRSPTGQARTIEADLAKQTDLVPAVLNTKFGFRFRVLGLPEGATARLRLRFTFPEMVNPGTGKVSTVYEGFGDVPVAPHTQGMFWDFVHPWEMRPGQWTMSIYNGDRLLVQKKFTIIDDSKSGRSVRL
jgi:hypothetical protein